MVESQYEAVGLDGKEPDSGSILVRCSSCEYLDLPVLEIVCLQKKSPSELSEVIVGFSTFSFCIDPPLDSIPT